MNSKNSEYIYKYFSLIEDFVSMKITAPEFEERYIAVLRGDSGFYSEDVAPIVYGLYSDVDEYCADPELRESGDLDNKQLWEKALAAYNELKPIIIIE